VKEVSILTEYIEREKIIVRHSVLSRAVELLTHRREESTIANADYVKNVRDFMKHQKENNYDKSYAALLSDSYINRWTNCYNSIVQMRKPSELKVAYLAGPNPENDLEELVKLGILPENVWAFEADKESYKSAVNSALSSKFPYIKIHKGNIANFAEFSPLKFDIIYLDFCGPLPNRNNKQKNLSTLVSLINSHTLNSPGVIITNFALPTQEQDPKGRELLSKLVALYLYPKEFLENNDLCHMTEGPICNGISIDDWFLEVDSNLECYYSQFITRLVIDLCTVIVPFSSLAGNTQYMSRFFTKLESKKLDVLLHYFYHFSRNGGGGDVITESGDFPILWSIANLKQNRNCKDINYSDLIYCDEDFKKFSDLFLNQLSGNTETETFIKNLETMHFLVTGRSTYFYSQTLKQLATKRWWESVYQFCDLFDFDSIVNLLIGQLSIPYHINISETKRWSYVAKKTPMFVDMFVLDECRYIYDWMPTLDMLENGIGDIERQLCYRFALDALAKHRRWYNAETFFGTAVIDQYQNGFEAKELTVRKHIE
jgi:hypothetical protein